MPWNFLSLNAVTWFRNQKIWDFATESTATWVVPKRHLWVRHPDTAESVQTKRSSGNGVISLWVVPDDSELISVRLWIALQVHQPWLCSAVMDLYSGAWSGHVTFQMPRQIQLLFRRIGPHSTQNQDVRDVEPLPWSLCSAKAMNINWFSTSSLHFGGVRVFGRDGPEQTLVQVWCPTLVGGVLNSYFSAPTEVSEWGLSRKSYWPWRASNPWNLLAQLIFHWPRKKTGSAVGS